MAWIERNQAGNFFLGVRWEGKQFRRKIAAKNETDANATLVRVEDTISLVLRGRLEIPTDVDLMEFLLTDGKAKPRTAEPKREPIQLKALTDRYLEVHSNGSREASTLLTAKIHLNHLVKTLGGSFGVADLTTADLQRHINRRVGKVAPYTISKEIGTLRAAWRWAKSSGLLGGDFPNRGLAYPKTEEKLPFMTMAEIERRIGRGGLKKEAIAALWDCLYLTSGEILEALSGIEEANDPPWLYPMAVTACHTGARRSELLRAQVDDVDFENRSVFFREKKRARGKRTTRRVPLSRKLEAVLTSWLQKHPGGQFLFCDSDSSEITRGQAHDHLKRTLEGTKFAHARGWHVFRHSAASNFAAAGIDQRFIDEWLGHQTEEMAKRYRHLFPDRERRAIDSAFT